MLVFAGAQSEWWLYVARLLQGFATGMASGALSAWLVDLQPPDNPRLGGLVASTALVLGLGAGALVAGVLVQLAPQPFVLVYLLLIAAYVAGVAAVAAAPDEVQRTPGWTRALRPEVAVPAPARHLFRAYAPSLIATWALAGLYLSVGPVLAILLYGSPNALIGGLVIIVLLGTGAVASTVTRDADARPTLMRASLLLMAGVAVSLLGVALSNLILFLLGTFVAGLGLGPAFSAAVRSLTPLAPPNERGALLAAVLVLIYLSFSLPAVAAGVAATVFGLVPTMYVYGTVVIALAAITAFALARRSVAVV